MLSNRDLRQALDCIQAIAATSEHEQFVAATIKVLHPLLRATLTGYNEADPIRKRFSFVVHPREMMSDAIIQSWVQLAHEHPLIRHVQDNPGDFAVYKITDFVSQRTFRKTALCHKIYSKCGGEYQMAMPFPIAGPAAIAVAFNRDHDFTERERELLTLLQPFITSAYCNVQRIGDLQLALDVAKQSADELMRNRRSSIGDLDLSERQTGVLRHLLKGQSNKQIAWRLHMSIRTVEKNVERLLKKLKVPNRAAACARFQGALP